MLVGGGRDWGKERKKEREREREESERCFSQFRPRFLFRSRKYDGAAVNESYLYIYYYLTSRVIPKKRKENSCIKRDTCNKET